MLSGGSASGEIRVRVGCQWSIEVVHFQGRQDCPFLSVWNFRSYRWVHVDPGEAFTFPSDCWTTYSKSLPVDFTRAFVYSAKRKLSYQVEEGQRWNLSNEGMVTIGHNDCDLKRLNLMPVSVGVLEKDHMNWDKLQIHGLNQDTGVGIDCRSSTDVGKLLACFSQPVTQSRVCLPHRRG